MLVFNKETQDLIDNYYKYERAESFFRELHNDNKKDQRLKDLISIDYDLWINNSLLIAQRQSELCDKLTEVMMEKYDGREVVKLNDNYQRTHSSGILVINPTHKIFFHSESYAGPYPIIRVNIDGKIQGCRSNKLSFI